MKNSEKKTDSRQVVRSILFQVSFFLELAVAFLLIVLIIGQVIGLGIQMFGNVDLISNSENFTYFLEICMNIVIGVEFLKMLCRHNIDVVVEVLLFTLARHMIVGQHQMIEGLLCVIAIAILFLVRRFLSVPNTKWKENGANAISKLFRRKDGESHDVESTENEKNESAE